MTRRSFIGTASVAGAAIGLAACSDATGSDENAIYNAPDAGSYPIDPDGDDVEALWTSEDIRAGWTKATNPNGVEIGVWDTAKIIQVDGLAFRDMNGDGKLDLWEDWRQSAEDRARALADELPREQIIPLMWHGGDTAMSITGEGVNTEKYGLLSQGSRAGCSRLCSTIDSYGSDIDWINEVQKICEESEWGIPYLNSTDPYQLFGLPDNIALGATMDKDVWRKAGMWLGRAWRATGVRCLLGPQIDVYSQPLGCRMNGSVSEDPALNRDFTQAFAGGLQSTWGDDEATDDQGWGKDSVAAMLKHFVGAGAVEGGRNDHADAGRYNVFPGDNFEAQLIPFLDGGLNLDSETGQMAAVMPCYGVAYDEDEKYGELVGAGYSKSILSILRNTGWDGMFCTDWQILNDETYGVADLSMPERYAKMVEAGEDQCGGLFWVSIFEDSWNLLVNDLGEDGALERVRDSARRIGTLMVHVGLFDQPYSDTTAAKEILESEAAASFGLEASEKSVVMLKNKDGIISEGGLGDAKVYMPVKKSEATMYSMMINEDSSYTFDTAFDLDLAKEYLGDNIITDSNDGENVVTVDDSELADVDYAIVRVSGPNDPNDGVTGGTALFGGDTGEPLTYHPITLQYLPYTADGPNVRQESIAHVDEEGNYENRSYYGQSSSASNQSDLDMVIDLRNRLPESAKIILLVEASNPMVFSEIEPYADVILFTWTMQSNLQGEAWARIIAGKTEPSGLLNAQMPADMDTVEASYEDVSRDLECYVDSEGNSYDFCFGLNWSGVIDDERTKTYKASPLTKTETDWSMD